MNRPKHGGNLAWAAAVAGCPPSAIVDFSASISPLGPPESVLAAIVAHLQDARAYPDPDYSELRAILALAHHLPSDWILPGNGSAELLTWAARELSELEATYLVTPAFGDYFRALLAFNAKVLKWPLGNGSLVMGNRAQLSQLPITNSRTGLLLNNPHNPTGQLFSSETILPLLKQFALVVVDEAFMDFVPPHQQQSLIPLVQEYPNLVILRSLTKFYSLPGLRLGYAIAHPNRLRQWQQWRDPWPVNVLAAAAAVAALQDKAFEQLSWDWLGAARPRLFQALAELPGLHPFPSAANFLLVKSEQSSVLIQEKLLQQSRILIRDCVSFPELGDRFFRVAVRSQADNQRLIEGLAQILN
ncbi:MAG TPA: threonine-phosphate decarboxylase [Cyanobacteria bacterium UBA11369]|nr:threonine-phosphate decarboxylase [Cyanobacteria bacterium UBA11371]HBE30898.1 threonine-phosphate decarboxylase [Cyanobacteria bacterium UBA11368]HBE54060.1 threonine-phosphate decarboxylase [Cyanobacteria bacterium UBA11369]